MKSLIAGSLVAATLAVSTVASVAPADAFFVGVGPRGGVHVGVGRPFYRGYGYRRGFIGHPYYRSGVVVGRPFYHRPFRRF